MNSSIKFTFLPDKISEKGDLLIAESWKNTALGLITRKDQKYISVFWITFLRGDSKVPFDKWNTELREYHRGLKTIMPDTFDWYWEIIE